MNIIVHLFLELIWEWLNCWFVNFSSLGCILKSGFLRLSWYKCCPTYLWIHWFKLRGVLYIFFRFLYDIRRLFWLFLLELNLTLLLLLLMIRLSGKVWDLTSAPSTSISSSSSWYWYWCCCCCSSSSIQWGTSPLSSKRVIHHSAWPSRLGTSSTTTTTTTSLIVISLKWWLLKFLFHRHLLILFHRCFIILAILWWLSSYLICLPYKLLFLKYSINPFLRYIFPLLLICFIYIFHLELHSFAIYRILSHWVFLSNILNLCQIFKK